MFKFRTHRLMNQAAEPAPGGAPEAPAAPAGQEGAPAAAAAQEPAAPSGSLLKSGSGPAPASGTDYFPEKLRVMREDGTVDVDETSRKLADAYGALEKRLGSGDAPPAAATDYKVAVPDAFKETIDPTKDAGIQGFLTGAHAAGMNQAQVDFVMAQYFTMAPQLVAGAAHLDAEGAKAELQKVWGTSDAEFKRNVNNAYTGANAIAQKAGIPIDELMGGRLGNDPMFLRMMAAIGPEFQEDRSIGATRMTAHTDITTLMSSEAYTNRGHPDHERVSAQVADYHKRKYGNEPA